MKKVFIILLACSFFAPMSFAQHNSARAGFTPDTTVPQAVRGGAEDFADITTLSGDGWILDNQSSPVGVSDWFQGNDAVFNAHAGASTAYIAANFNNTAGSDICNWLIMPDNGFLQSVTFWTRTTMGSTFPDRLYVVHSPTGGTTTGDCFMDFGDFTNNLLMINDGLVAGGYPDDWTEFTVNPNSAGRVALVYFVADGGPVGTNSDYIGIDTVSFVAGISDADLSLVITNDAAPPVSIGQSFFFTLTASNAGPGDAVNAVVNATLSANASVSSNGCVSLVGNDLTWNIGNLVNGAMSTCSVNVMVDDLGSINMTGSIMADNVDPVPANNAGSNAVTGVTPVVPSMTTLGLMLMGLLLLFVTARRFARA